MEFETINIEFDHDGKKYLIKKTSLFIFHEVLPGRDTPSKLFTAEITEDASLDDFIEEIENRKALRASAVNNIFRLDPLKPIPVEEVKAIIEPETPELPIFDYLPPVRENKTLLKRRSMIAKKTNRRGVAK